MHARKQDFPETSDSHLIVARIRSGDEKGFEEMFRSYYTRLVHASYSYTRSRALAEEVVQDVFTRIWNKHSSFGVTTTLTAYLYGAVRNESLKAAKRSAAEQKWKTHVLRSADDPNNSADTDLYKDELTTALSRAVEELPERCREVFRLFREHNLRAPEIAAVLGISPATVRVQLSRAIHALRDRLADYRG